MKYPVLFPIIQKVSKEKDDQLINFSSLIEEVWKVIDRYERTGKTMVVIKENAYLATRFYEQMAAYYDRDDIVLYLPEESLRAEAVASSYENIADRLNALYQIIQGKAKIIICTPYGFIRHLPTKEELLKAIRTLKVNDEMAKEELIAYLNAVGYNRTGHVDVPLTYASRGSIVDVYAINYDQPIRIEFFGDEIASLRFFDLNSQRTIKEIKEATICFAKDVFFNDEEKAYLEERVAYLSDAIQEDIYKISSDIFSPDQYFYYSYFRKCHLKDYLDDHLLYLSDEIKIEEHLKFLTADNVAYIQEMVQEERLPSKFDYCGDYYRLITQEKKIIGKPFGALFPPLTEVDLPYLSLDSLMAFLARDQHSCIIIALDDKHYADFKAALDESHTDYRIVKDAIHDGINLLKADLTGGFEIKEENLILYTATELFKTQKRIGRFGRKYEEATVLSSYEELNEGDYVVHDQYGIGRFMGIEKREVNDVTSDYLKIVYRGNDELLVPLAHFKLVRKYVSKEGVVPKLHKLGSTEWRDTKAKVAADVRQLAQRLVALYAYRESEEGFAFSQDSAMQKAFEDEFPYELTPDQDKAIKEVKKDMESKKPMDRLLCGDVGFGKTEVAIRAAFKAVLDHKQVAYLCPTTVLSLQHYETFKARFASYPINIVLLNRYVPLSTQKEVLHDLKEGKVDILIGTHRILSGDVDFNDLGLLIIDEEQRFGVEHKEKIKELKKNIDVLSLSATPIPRTLQMSLIGIRSLSTLNTPPQNRYPIQTYVVYKSEGLIKEVIMRELVRHGQVFYLFNNIDEIHAVQRKLQKELPDAKLAVVHGKMAKEEMEDVMMDFHQNKIDVLICTTIIETGLDIPNANTIIIDNAQNFGLAQLYQIKGRVGRSDKVAYAYLMIPPLKQLPEKGSKRLEAIKEFTALGSGYKIAMRDLAIRGAGDLLGPKQSGFIDNVGLDLYLMMLEEAISQAKGEKKVLKKEHVALNLPVDSYIPESFTQSDYDKLTLYHSLEAIASKEALLEYYLKVQDEYGKLPHEVRALFEQKRLDLFVEWQDVESIKAINKQLKITLSSSLSDRLSGLKVFEIANDLSKDITIRYTNQKIVFFLPLNGKALNLAIALIEKIPEALQDAH